MEWQCVLKKEKKKREKTCILANRFQRIKSPLITFTFYVNATYCIGPYQLEDSLLSEKHDQWFFKALRKLVPIKTKTSKNVHHLSFLLHKRFITKTLILTATHLSEWRYVLLYVLQNMFKYLEKKLRQSVKKIWKVSLRVGSNSLGC